ncbi:MAG: hypothetical protein JXR91_09875 [Deltaproteobacteria bacterium]|nr:hypothetical protein [Deltaproteobacteria bacterium]
MNTPRLRLGEILVNSKVLTPEQLEEALLLQKQHQLRLGTILLQHGYVSESHLLQALSHHLSIPWVSLKLIDIVDRIIRLVPANVAEEFFLIPIYIRTEKTGEQALYVAMNDPLDQDALRFVQATAGMTVRPMLAAPSDIAAAIRYYYYDEEYVIPNLQKVSTSATTEPQQVNDVEAEEVEDLSDEMEVINVDSIAPPPEDITEQIPPPAMLDNDIESETTAKESTPEPEREEEPALKDADKSEEPKDLFEDKEAAQREAERRIYGVGHPKKSLGFALTLLDGTKLSFNSSKDKNTPQNEKSGELSADNLIAGLIAAANGTPLDDFLPAEKWQSYTAAMLKLMFKKGLLMYDEFIREVKSIEKK